MMATREIPRQEWASFFDLFSRIHKGWPATVDVMGEDIGAQTEVRSLPFAGISADWKDNESRVEVTLGISPGASITRGVASPEAVYVKQSDAVADEVLEVRSADGTVTLVHFHTIATAGQLNEDQPAP